MQGVGTPGPHVVREKGVLQCAWSTMAGGGAQFAVAHTQEWGVLCTKYQSHTLLPQGLWTIYRVVDSNIISKHNNNHSLLLQTTISTIY